VVDFADNLAANFSRELADYIIYIIDVPGGGQDSLIRRPEALHKLVLL
jgi:Ni2+-binding GTPase involved in maturation of urease and hydrogenase